MIVVVSERISLIRVPRVLREERMGGQQCFVASRFEVSTCVPPPRLELILLELGSASSFKSSLQACEPIPESSRWRKGAVRLTTKASRTASRFSTSAAKTGGGNVGLLEALVRDELEEEALVLELGLSVEEDV